MSTNNEALSARVAARRAQMRVTIGNAAADVKVAAADTSPTPRALSPLMAPGSPYAPQTSVSTPGTFPGTKAPVDGASDGPVSPGSSGEAHIVLSLDYGTTFTGVAYAQSSDRAIDIDDIRVVTAWPGRSEVKVPSQISYSRSRKRCKQFGYDIDEESEVLSKTKLELDETNDRGKELTSFTQTLHGLASLKLDNESALAGSIPRHLAKNAEDIVEDYLKRIAEVVFEDMADTLGRAVPQQIPIDMVITHPARWSSPARNKTYRAAIKAFSEHFQRIRHVSFVSEPVACAHYTMRAAQKVDHGRFRKNDCFIVVDAGGGTVDVASFQITEIDTEQNRFRMKPVGPPSGASCGSTFVDEGFISILRERLTKKDSEKIVENSLYGGGGHFVWSREGMQVYKDFLPVKHQFTGEETTLNQVISLPRNLDIQDDPGRGISAGNLNLSVEDIRKMFGLSVDTTLTLIEAQITALESSPEAYRVKSIFLSGGFANSEYLFEKVSDFAGQEQISVERGQDCWSAVSKGAVMKGLGLLTEKPSPITRSPCSYGIKTRMHYSKWRNTDDNVEVDQLGNRWATDQIKWFVKKGDAILPSEPQEFSYKCHWLLQAKDFDAPSSSVFGRNKRTSTNMLPPVYRDVVFMVSDETDAPTRYKELKADAVKPLVIQCDMRRVPQPSQERYQDKMRNIKCSVEVKVRVSVTEVTVSVVSGNVVVAGPERIPLTFRPSAS